VNGLFHASATSGLSDITDSLFIDGPIPNTPPSTGKLIERSE